MLTNRIILLITSIKALTNNFNPPTQYQRYTPPPQQQQMQYQQPQFSQAQSYAYQPPQPQMQSQQPMQQVRSPPFSVLFFFVFSFCFFGCPHTATTTFPAVPAVQPAVAELRLPAAARAAAGAAFSSVRVTALASSSSYPPSLLLSSLEVGARSLPPSIC